jgi:hypothetical protein
MRPTLADESRTEQIENGRTSLGQCLVIIEMISMRVDRALVTLPCRSLLGPAADDLANLSRRLRDIQSRYEGGAMQ